MPGGFALPGSIVNMVSVGVDAANSRGVSIAFTPANTKSAYVQVTASTAFDAAGLFIFISVTSSVCFGAAVDIAVGAAGSEVIIANNLYIGSAAGASPGGIYVVPVPIPAGTRIAVRAQGDAADTCYVGVQTYDASYEFPTFAGIDSIGFLTASTTGTTIDSGTVLNTVGSYVQLTASTAQDYAALIVTTDNLLAGTGTGIRALLDIAIGGAGSEVVVIPQLDCTRGGAQPQPQASTPFFVPIPSGTRIAARAQCNSTTAGTRNIGLTLYGIY